MSGVSVTPQISPTPKWVVQAPDGKVIQFPDSFQQSDVEREMNNLYPAPEDSLTKTEDFFNDLPNNVASGFVKGAGRTVSNVSRGLNKIPFFGKYLAPMVGISALDSYTQPSGSQGDPSGIGEKIGSGAEQLGEMELTGGPLKSGAEAIANQIPAFARYLAPALRIGANAANAAVSAKLHDQPIGTSALIGGGSSALGEAAPALVGPLKNAAISQYTRALAPTTKANKAITQDIVPSLIQRGVHGSLDALQDTAESQAGAVRPALDNAYDAAEAKFQPTRPPIRALLPAAPTEVPLGSTAPLQSNETGVMLTRNPDTANQFVKPQGSYPVSKGGIPGAGKQIVQDLENLKNDYVVGGQVANPQAVNAINGVQGIVRQQGADISPKSLRQLKQIFDEPVATANGYAGTDLATHYSLNAQQAAANSIRTILHQASPDINALDKEISFWLNVQRVTRDSGLRQTGQQGGLLKVLRPLAYGSAGGIGLATHSPQAGIEAALAASLAAGAGSAVRSPAWRTASALVKDRLANALASGDAAQVGALLGRFGVSMQEGQSPTAQTPGQLPVR